MSYNLEEFEERFLLKFGFELSTFLNHCNKSIKQKENEDLEREKNTQRELALYSLREERNIAYRRVKDYQKKHKIKLIQLCKNEKLILDN